MKNHLAVINAGSSSIKFALYDVDESLSKRLHGSIINIRTKPQFRVFNEKNDCLLEEAYSDSHEYGFFYDLLLSYFSKQKCKVQSVGHRVVHGGEQYQHPVVTTPKVLEDLKKLIPFAPLHQPFNLLGIESVSKLDPMIRQVACFDTAFHHTHPPVAARFGIPRALSEEGIRRYGFHGLSYEFILTSLKELVPDIDSKKVIVAHLGNGASLCGINNGVSVDSTMGFTALDGLIMGTRCGSLDPGVLLYLLQSKKLSYEKIEQLLYKESGLLGISAISGNMQVLLDNDTAPAREAIDSFIYRAQREIGALMNTLGGLDILVFTGGIGENAPLIRERLCETLTWCGTALDKKANNTGKGCIHKKASTIEVRVIPTNEELVIAKHTHQLLSR